MARQLPRRSGELAYRRRAVASKTVAGRSLGDFLPLLPAEQTLLRSCRLGEVAKLREEVPEGADCARRVRAAFLRFLLLGGDTQAPVHEQGVQLVGASVTGVLDLDGCRIPHNVGLDFCRFSHPLRAHGARVSGLMTFQGSLLSGGIEADELQCEGGLHLRDGFKATGEVRLLGARISGNLDCSDGCFEVGEGDALSADGALVKGDVVLSGAFTAVGEVRLLGARIHGDLQCGGGQFSVEKGDALSADGAVVKGNVFLNNGFKALGEVRLLATQIGCNLDCRGAQFEVGDGFALSTENAIVKGAWFFDGPAYAVRVSAQHMQVAVLTDALESWAEGSVLDGLRYGALGGDAPTRAKDRLAWLRKQPAQYCGEDFRPQPWHQLQRVLREMGHTEDARQIAIAYERQMRMADRIGQSPPSTWEFAARGKWVIARMGHWLFGLLSGYGYRPMRLMAWMVGVWLGASLLFWFLALPPHNAIGPADPLVFQNPRYAQCVPDSPAAAAAAASGVPNAGNWYLCGPLPADYSTFSPLTYSLDILLPLVDLGQQKAWGPRVTTPKAGFWDEWTEVGTAHVVRWLVWFETLFGWISGLLLVSIVSGLARRSED